MEKCIAMYLRLSHADNDIKAGDKDESNSIENQRELIRHFIEKRSDLEGEVTEYVDDGYTGTNFERPGFMRMVEDAKAGKIHTIIVKDLSRLGRNYIGVGDYLEQIFPALNIRFIAVNSNYDSNNFVGNTIGIDTSLTNLINNLYSKDLSKKGKSAKRALWKKGVTTAGKQPYGYIRDYSEPHKWVIDEEAAAVVRTIFKMAAGGSRTIDIVEYLNTHEIPIPAKYRLEKYGEKCGNIKTHELLWNTGGVWRILRNYSYTGCAVQGKVETLVVGTKHGRKVPENKRYYIANALPQIVSEKLFEKAQGAIGKQRTKAMSQDAGNVLTGKIRCGNCKLTMSYKGKYEKSIYCPHASISGHKSQCCRDDYSALAIEGQVRYAINNQLKLLFDLSYQLKERRKAERGNAETIIKEAKKRLEYLKAEKIRQYEAYADGHLTREQFIDIKKELDEERKTYEERLSVLLEEDENEKNLQFELNRIETKAAGIMKGSKLTREMVNSFIDVIYLYDPEHIEIKFCFEDLLGQLMKQLEI